MNKIICITTTILLMLSLSACKEEEVKQPELKTVDYWLENNEERQKFFINECRNKLEREYTNDNCHVVKAIHSKSIAHARKAYAQIISDREQKK